MTPERGGCTLLADEYEHCRAITARHGRSYYLAARLLPPERRRAVHALYAFARTIDDIVDGVEGVEGVAPADPIRAARALDDAAAVVDSLGSDAPARTDPVFAAFTDTARRFGIPHEYFGAFLDSMRMDVPGTPNFRSRYASWAALGEYMYGSAVVIGLQLLPVLGAADGAEPHAAALGEAFQLTNFLRDVGEDLDRGRVYLPQDELAAFGVDDDLLRWCRERRSVDRRVARALAHLIAVTRSLYRTAAPGIAMLDPRARPAIATALRLYEGILDEIEAHEYAVLHRRVTVTRTRRLALVAREMPRLAARPAVRTPSPAPA
ncbi:phytoene/squalene synthase family protein [Rhodococcus sp. HNM0569]|uniref:phytoene/squalene synthase family protein n=1 Tax=Rhodococcus sp. HNM0569 TaxID=2716340 RepID=UPI00146C382D|nr:phytoene/squalene synthase family protein [Rhodococcus sp. HNM0569]NLU82902.1 phytoene/squalene synthase family protein [Rhodococcus sp. HNM0569]